MEEVAGGPAGRKERGRGYKMAKSRRLLTSGVANCHCAGRAGELVPSQKTAELDLEFDLWEIKDTPTF